MITGGFVVDQPHPRPLPHWEGRRRVHRDILYCVLYRSLYGSPPSGGGVGGGVALLPLQHQAIRRVLRFQRIHIGLRPVDKGLFLRFRQDRVAVDPGIGSQRHFTFFHHFDQLFELVVLHRYAGLNETGEIQVFFAVFHMIRQPPCHGLHLGVPGVNGIIGMAVVAGYFQNGLYRIGHRVFFGNVVGQIVGLVFCRADKLRQQKNDQKAEQDGFDVLFHGCDVAGRSAPTCFVLNIMCGKGRIE